MNCDLAKCSLNMPGAPDIPCMNEEHGNKRTRADEVAYQARLTQKMQLLQSRLDASTERLAHMPVTLCPKVHAALVERSDLLADIEHHLRHCHRPNDPRSAGKALLEYLQSRPNLFTGVRF